MANRGTNDFQWHPTWVTPRAKLYAVLVTPSESFKKDRQLLDDNSVDIYDLEFEGVSDTNRNAILAQYSGVSAEYDSFWWNTVPTYLNVGTSLASGYSGLTVNYVANSYKETPRARSWDIFLSLEVAV